MPLGGKEISEEGGHVSTCRPGRNTVKKPKAGHFPSSGKEKV